MPVAFGFSVGDFIAAIELVQTIADALRDSGEASAEYRSLIRQLYGLEDALLHVKKLDDDEISQAGCISLRQAAAQCRVTIDDFMSKLEKYHGYLGQPVTSGLGTAALKGRWRRVQWALCKEKDLERFRIDLLSHTQSIQMLLVTIQMANSRLDSRNGEQQRRTLTGRIESAYLDCMQKLSTVSDTLSTGIDQGKQLLDGISNIVRTNVQIFQIVLGIQHIITSIPGQIQRQQPVFLIDALGRASPFHLEFVRSPEALIAVLAANLDKHKVGNKVRAGEFVIEDSTSKTDIDLRRDWELCFQPGQLVEMSMVFKRRGDPEQECPKCRSACNGEADVDMECSQCGLTFRRVADVTEEGENDRDLEFHHETELESNTSSRKHSVSSNEDELQIALFRKIRLKIPPLLHVWHELRRMRSDREREEAIAEYRRHEAGEHTRAMEALAEQHRKLTQPMTPQAYQEYQQQIKIPVPQGRIPILQTQAQHNEYFPKRSRPDYIEVSPRPSPLKRTRFDPEDELGSYKLSRTQIISSSGSRAAYPGHLLSPKDNLLPNPQEELS